MILDRCMLPSGLSSQDKTFIPSSQEKLGKKNKINKKVQIKSKKNM